MSTHDPKKVVKRYYEEVGNQRQLSVADEIIAPDFKLFPHSAPPYGPEGVKQFITWLCIEGFPDLTVTIEELIAEGNTVAARVTLHAMHTAQLSWLNDLGITAPTGKRFDMEEFVFWRVNRGKITERHILIDRLGVAQQLGMFQSGEGRPPS